MTSFLTFPGDDPAPVATKTAAPASTASVTDAVSAQVMTEQGSLNLREFPRSDAKVLTTIPQYQIVSTSQRGTVWCQVTYGGVTGWVMTNFLSFTPSSSLQPAAPADNKPDDGKPQSGQWKELKTPVLAQVLSPNGKKLNLRAKNKKNAKVLFKVPGGEYLIVTAVSGDWCRVTYDNREVYCMSQYLEYTLYE